MSDCKTDGRPMLHEPEWQAARQIGYRWTQPQALTEAEQWLTLIHNG